MASPEGPCVAPGDVPVVVEHLYRGGLFSGDYHPYIGDIRKKPVGNLDLNEACIYLTALAKHDRICEGLFDASIQNGLIAGLLERWLELTHESEPAKSQDEKESAT